MVNTLWDAPFWIYRGGLHAVGCTFLDVMMWLTRCGMHLFGCNEVVNTLWDAMHLLSVVCMRMFRTATCENDE